MRYNAVVDYISKDYYQKMTFPGAHASASFQQKILAEWLKRITKTHSIKTILDIGSGLGFNLPTLSHFCSQVWSTDISPAALQEAKKEHPNLKNIHYLVCDAQKIKFPNGYFDLVVCTEVLEHIQNQEKVIRGIVRILKPNGFLIISTPNYQNLTGLIKWYKDKKAKRECWEPWEAHRGGLEKRMTPGIIQKLLSGPFRIIKTRGANYLLAWLYFLPLRQYYDLFPFLTLGEVPFIKKFGMQYYILAQKND